MDPQVYLCEVDTPDGTRHYVSLLPPEVFFKQGLVAEAILGTLLGFRADQPVNPENFARNSVFVDFLQSVIARHAPQLPRFLAEAQRIENGWVYVIDQRTLNPDGAIPPEDIFGGFAVEAGKVVPE